MPITYSSEQAAREENARLIEMITAGGELKKTAEDSTTDYTKMILREHGFFDTIMPPKTLMDSEWDLAPDHTKPIKYVDREPYSPPAYALPLNQAPAMVYLRQARYAVTPTIWESRKAVVDVNDIRCSTLDIRQIFSDNFIKDLMTARDTAAITGFKNAMGGAANTVTPFSGVAQWRSANDGLSRDNYELGKAIMMSTLAAFSPRMALANQVTMLEWNKWNRSEVGGDKAQQFLFNGMSEDDSPGEIKYITTIKRNLVGDGTFYYFGPEEAFGKHYMVYDATMNLDREGRWVSFYVEQYSGAAIGNGSTVTRVDYQM